MAWMQELTALTDYISRNGSSEYVLNEVGKVLKSSCKKDDDYTLLINSQPLHFIINSYTDQHKDLLFKDFGFKVLGDLITRTAALPTKSNVGIRFIMNVVAFLDKKDSLYHKSRRIFLKMGPNLSKGEEGSKEFFQFFEEIVNEVYYELCGFLEVETPLTWPLTWPDTSSLVMYVAYLEKNSRIGETSDVYERCIALLQVMTQLLNACFVKSDSGTCFDLLMLLTRLAKLYVAENDIQTMVNGRIDRIMELAVLVMENDQFPRIKTWLEDRKLIQTFFLALIRKLNGLFALVSKDTVSESTLITYGQTLSTAKTVSKEVYGGGLELENLLKDRQEEELIMSRMLLLVKENYCPDENLALIENLLDFADPELKQSFFLSIIPEIKEGIPFEIKIDRTTLLKASRDCVLSATSTELSGKLFVKFKKEEGIGSGVTREWLYLVCQKLFDPEHNYFKSDGPDPRKVFPTLVHVEDLNFYTFFGRLLAIALIHRVQVGFTLDPIVVLLLAELDVSIEHVKKHDPRLYQNMMEQVVPYRASQPDLLPPDQKDNKEGKDKLVAENNKKNSQTLVNEYILELIAEKMARIKGGIDYIFGTSRRILFFRNLKGSHMDMLICGDRDDLSVDDWENHTIYEEYQKDDIHITSFWKIVRGLTTKQRRELLFFWTSIEFLPPGGFCNLAFQPVIQKTTSNSYPRASTCSYTLQIPPVPYEDLKYRLHVTIQQPTGFGFQ